MAVHSTTFPTSRPPHNWPPLSEKQWATRLKLRSPPLTAVTDSAEWKESEMLPPATTRQPAPPHGMPPNLPQFNGTSSLEDCLVEIKLFAAEYAWTDCKKPTCLS